MEIVILDIGGTSIKYAKCIDGEMYKTAECESEAGKGGVYGKGVSAGNAPV